jgi:type VI secretion system protein ImpA
MDTEFAAELARLTEPLEPSTPCGVDLDGSPELVALESQRVFGLLTTPETEPDWRELRSQARLALNRSKDLRVLAHFAAAITRTGTLLDAVNLFALLETWLTRYWDEVYPRLDEDAIARRNAINCFADRVAVIDPLRRLPLIVHPQLGAFSLRDIDIATGVQPNPDVDREPRNETEVSGAFQDADITRLQELHAHTQRAAQALARVQEIMRARGGEDSIPALEPITKQLARIQQLLFPRIGNELAQASTESSSGDVVSTQRVAGMIRSRQDAVRALEAVVDYFRRNEPSSPVPLVVERAKRMVSMDFLEVLADLAPEALEQARKATGVQKTD